MANIPGMPGVLPGVFGPSGTEMIKTEKGYAFGWKHSEMWGGPHINGSPKEIARDLIIRYGKILDLPPSTYTLSPVRFYGAISIIWKPDLIVSLYDGLHIGDGVNTELFIDEITKELNTLKKLLPFA